MTLAGPEKAILPRKRQQLNARPVILIIHKDSFTSLQQKQAQKGADRTALDVMRRVENYLILGYYWRDVRAASNVADS